MHRRLLLRATSLAALAAFLSPARAMTAGAPWMSPLLRDHPLVGRIWDTGAQVFVPLGALIQKLRHAHFRLLGEVHDNPDAHAMQAKLVDAIGATGLTPR